MKRHLNLMSSKARLRERVRYCSRIWSRVLAVTLLVFAQLGLVQWWNCRGVGQHRDSLEAQYEPFRQFKAENTKYKSKLESLLVAERIPLMLSEETPLPVLFGLVGRVVSSAKGEIYLEALQLSQDPLSQSTATQHSPKIVLEGVGLHSRAVTQFADALRAAIPFTSVDLGSTEAVQLNTDIRQAFSIECTF